MNLKQLQQLFSIALNNSSKNDFLCHIRESAQLSAKKRLAIYQDSIVAGLVTALKNVYAVCYQLVGDEFFNAMSEKYIQQHPAISPDMGEYGENFSVFIQNFKPAASLPYLPDVANLEWMWAKVCHQKKEKYFDANSLACVPEISEPYIVLKLPKDSALIKSYYPSFQIWKIHQENFATEKNINIQKGEYYVFIWRKGDETYMQELTFNEWQLLNAIQQGKKLQEFSEEQLQALPVLFSRNWIGGFEIDADNC